MTNVTFKGEPVTLAGKFPQVGDTVGDFKLTNTDLKEITLQDFKNKKLILLSIFPSLDTPVCSESVINFNKTATNMQDSVVVLCISKDLPFAQKRFCGVQEINNALTLSAFRNSEFAKQMGVDIVDSPLRGLLARAIILLNHDFKVLYTQLVANITDKPDYEECLAFIANYS